MSEEKRVLVLRSWYCALGGSAPHLHWLVDLHQPVDARHQVQNGSLELGHSLVRRCVLLSRLVNDPNDVVERGHGVQEHLDVARVALDGVLVLDPAHVVVHALQEHLVHLVVAEVLLDVHFENRPLPGPVLVREALEHVREEREDGQDALDVLAL